MAGLLAVELRVFDRDLLAVVNIGRPLAAVPGVEIREVEEDLAVVYAVLPDLFVSLVAVVPVPSGRLGVARHVDEGHARAGRVHGRKGVEISLNLPLRVGVQLGAPGPHGCVDRRIVVDHGLGGVSSRLGIPVLARGDVRMGLPPVEQTESSGLGRQMRISDRNGVDRIDRLNPLGADRELSLDFTCFSNIFDL